MVQVTLRGVTTRWGSFVGVREVDLAIADREFHNKLFDELFSSASPLEAVLEGLTVPTLIQWDVSFHPSQRLPESGCRMMKLEAFHPAPAPLRDALAALDLASRLALHEAPRESPQLLAYLKTPRGLVELD